ncbi:MAG TPA: thioredoxin family protein [Candidatus Eisenbacteria bacterium]|nr:thioredoxin family protein [Candidatus Eisenbacteria bacterium]
MEGLVALLAALALASAAGLWLRRSGRRITRATTVSDDTPTLDATDLGQPLGERATLVQFSTAFCQPCRATRRVLADVAGLADGVAHVEIDAESHLELVRRLDIMRTPTVLVLDQAGRVVRRASGQPRKEDVLAALGAAVS